MATAPFTPPRKKPSVIWWIAGLLFTPLFVFIYRLFGPNPRIILSPQTTYITSPLKPNGLPDYEQYTFDLYRKGVTSENKAAVPIWQALWPVDLSPAEQSQMSGELGLDLASSTVTPLADLDSVVPQIDAWLKQSAPVLAKSDDSDSESVQPLSAAANQTESTPGQELLWQTDTRPWTSQQIPPLAEWIAQNTKTLDSIIEASRRPRFYSPSKGLLYNQDISLAEKMYTQSFIIGTPYGCLLRRAMWHVGEGRMEDACRDLLDAHQLARLLDRGHSLNEKLAALSFRYGTYEAELALIADPRLSAAQARKIYEELAALDDFSGLDDAFDTMERIYYLDAVTRVAAGQTRLQKPQGPGVPFDTKTIAHLTDVTIDWNEPLIKGNEMFDRAVAAMRLPTDAARRSACSTIMTDVRDMQQPRFNRANNGSMVAMALSPAQRTEAVTALMLQQFFPDLEAALNNWDCPRTMLELTRLAAALSVYRAEQNHYPQKLEDLVPAIVDTLPVDLYNAKPFIYKRTADGYLLYSAGPNGRDDGGSDRQYTFEGQQLYKREESAAAPLRAKIPTGADDISIRVPRPPLSMPATTAPTGDR